MIVNKTDAQSPVRLLIAGHSGLQGGAELCLDTTLRYLDRSRYQATVYFGSEGPMVYSARKLGISVGVLPLAWWMCYERSLWHCKNLVLGGLEVVCFVFDFIGGFSP